MKFFVGCFLLLTGCATYQGKVSPARELIQQQKFSEAASLLKPLSEKVNGDQLVYLMDYGTALHLAGDFEESNKAFLQADKLAEQLDYHSVSKQAGSLLLNEEMVQYKGDTFERVFIHAYLAMNFVSLGKMDEALVEARRINQKYQKFRMDEKKAFEVNVFGKYLSALIWEATRQWDDAYIAYLDSYKVDPQIPGIREDLIRMAKLSRRPDEYLKWKKEFPDVVEDPAWYDQSLGEVFILLQQGWGPRKVFSQDSHRFPELKPVSSRTQKFKSQLSNRSSSTEDHNLLSRRIYSVESAAIKTLKDDYAGLVAKRLAGMAAKEVVADQIRQKNELLGFFAWVTLHASDRADLRQWSLLPESIHLIRVPVKPGNLSLNIVGLDSSGLPTGEGSEGLELSIKAKQKKFIFFRSVR